MPCPVSAGEKEREGERGDNVAEMSTEASLEMDNQHPQYTQATVPTRCSLPPRPSYKGSSFSGHTTQCKCDQFCNHRPRQLVGFLKQLLKPDPNGLKRPEFCPWGVRLQAVLG